MKQFLARFWFPLALICLLLVGLPGLVLFILNLLGRESAVNRWLQETLQLSYHIPIPGWAMWLMLLVPAAIVLLYFLKLKRKPLSVPSTFLWRKSIEDLHVNSLFQWLRENVLLLLQILAVLAVIYGVMAFHLHGRTGQGRHYILMMDNSASMAAADVSPNRLAQAKKDALEIIDSYSENDFGMLIVFNSSAEIRQSYTSNRDELRRAVENIEPTQRPTRIEEAFSLADSLANPVRSTEDVASRPEKEVRGKERTYVQPQGINTEVHLFSDGRFPDLSDSALANLNSRAAGNESPLGNLNLHFHMAGVAGPEHVDNVGLVELNASRGDRDPGKVHVFLRAQNFRPADVNARVELEVLVNGALKDIYPKSLVLPPRKVVTAGEQGKSVDTPGEASATFELDDLDDRSNVILHAKLVDVHDQFPLDDEAWRTVGAVRKARVLIVGPSNEVLSAFFDDAAQRAVANVTRLAPDDLGKEAYLQPARNGVYDLVIFDRCAPRTEAEMPRANTFLIGYPPPPWQRSKLPTLEYPAIRGWRHKNPVLRYLTALYEIGIKKAFQMTNLPDRTPRLIESDRETALLLTLSRNFFTDLVLTFPILDEDGNYNTTWPGETSFPIFLRNILYALGNVNDAGTEDKVQPGQVKILRPDDPVRRVTVVGPDHQSHELTHDERDLRSEFSFADTNAVGLYGVRWGGATRRYFSVNLLDENESNIEPRTAIPIGNEQIAAGQEISQPREIWKWFALAALVVLLVEWYIYNRRVYV